MACTHGALFGNKWFNFVLHWPEDNNRTNRSLHKLPLCLSVFLSCPVFRGEVSFLWFESIRAGQFRAAFIWLRNSLVLVQVSNKGILYTKT